MSTNFPSSLDTSVTLPAESASTPLSTNHVTAHQNIQDALEAVEAKIGVDGSAVTTSHDYKLGEVTSTDKAVGKTATQTLTNKTLGTGTAITLGSDAEGDTYYRNSSNVLVRLARGTDNYIYKMNGNVPNWEAEAVISNATTTSAGISELATSAQITAGTATESGNPLVVTPDQLALSTPVFNGSGITNITAANVVGGTTPAYFEISSPVLSLTPGNAVSYCGTDTSQSNPNYIWFAYGDQTTNIWIYRFDKQSSGNYMYKGVTVNIATTSTNAILGITEMGSKVYIRYRDNGTNTCKQYATDLTGVQTITGFGTVNIQSGMCSDADGITIWTFDASNTNLKSYTVSGTTATNTSTVTLSVGISTGAGRIFRATSGDFYSTDLVDGTLIQKWNSSGTNQTSLTARVFNYVANIEAGIGLIKIGQSVYEMVAQKLDATNSWKFQFKGIDLT